MVSLRERPRAQRKGRSPDQQSNSLVMVSLRYPRPEQGQVVGAAMYWLINGQTSQEACSRSKGRSPEQPGRPQTQLQLGHARSAINASRAMAPRSRPERRSQRQLASHSLEKLPRKRSQQCLASPSLEKLPREAVSSSRSIAVASRTTTADSAVIRLRLARVPDRFQV